MFTFVKYQLFFFLSILSYSAYAQQTQIKYLSGKDKDHTVEWDFYCSKGRNSGKWDKIPVPSNWETKGFGNYNYGWEEDYKSNEIGMYKHTFKSSPDWKNKTVLIVFEGSMTDTEVKINGKLAGPIHQGSFYRFKYDISKLLKPETENLLEVKVSKISADTSVNRAERMSDFWVFGGIYRPVYLEIVPNQYIEWTAIDAKANGSFLMEVYPANVKDANIVEGQIKTMDGKALGEPFSTTFKKGEKKITIKTKIDNVKTWNPESPNLYQVEIRLKNSKGIVHTVTEKFGFRTVEFREGDGFYVNGTKIIMKGVNRHSAWPTSGRTMSKELSIMDVNLMKDMNMNSVRMSHYPPDKHFLEVCDSLGLFVLDELTGWQKKYDTPVGRKLVKEMIVRDVNHPSIIIWDNGNEGGNNHEIVNDYHLYDPQKRKVIHPWNIFQGTDTQHYRGYGCCAGSLVNGDLVFFPTEILHGLYDGGHGAGLNDYWNLMTNNPLFAGFFLWVFADEGVVRDDMEGWIDVKKNAAPDGIVGPYREKEGSFYTIKEIWSPVHVKNEKLVSSFDGTLSIENRYLYTNLDQVKFNWKVVRLTSPLQLNSAPEIIYQGELKGPSIAPQKGGDLKLDLPTDFQNADVLYLTATDNHGRHVYTWSWPLKSPKEINEPLLKASSAAKVSAREEGNAIILSANGVEVGIDKQSGLLSQVKNQKSPISFTNGPVLATGTTEFKSLKHHANGNEYIVEATHSGDLKNLKYSMLPSGILKIEYAYFLKRGHSENAIDFLGINFNYPEEKITGVKYLGRGPYRVWKNRMKGGEFNIWDKKYNNTVTGESWDYPEFKGYYRDFNWVVVENKEHPFVIYTDTENLFLRLYTPEKPKGAKNDNNSPPFPEGDISIMHGISAIGTKFDAATNHGPESQKNKVGAEWIHGTLYLDFTARD